MRRTIFGLFLVSAVAALGCPAKEPNPPLASVAELPNPAEAPQPTKPRVHAETMTEGDWKSALQRSYPDPLRQGKSDEQVALDLDLKAWAFEYNGGPIDCWLEFEELGQATIAKRLPDTGDWECKATNGRIIFSVGRGASERMKQIMQKAGKDAEPKTVGFQLSYSDGDGKSGSYGMPRPDNPLWFGWPRDGQGFLTAASSIGAVRDGEVFTLLRIESDELEPKKEEAPRKATLMLKGMFGKAKKN